MKISSLEKPMFRNVYSADDNEMKYVCEYISWVKTSGVYDEIKKCVFKPSQDSWESWLSDTFIGFSSDKTLIYSGFNFSYSFLVSPQQDDNATSIRVIYRKFRKLFTEIFRHCTTKNVEKEFIKFYPKMTIPKKHQWYESCQDFFILASWSHFYCLQFINQLMGKH